MNDTHENITRERTVEGSSDRNFGLVFAVFFLIVALYPLMHGSEVRVWPLVVSGVFLVSALAAPRLLAVPNRLWTRFGLLLNKITNPIVLGILYYGVFVPFGLFLALAGKNHLRLGFDKGIQSYWVDRPPSDPDTDSMRNQF
jgi:hypothetical protein